MCTYQHIPNKNWYRLPDVISVPLQATLRSVMDHILSASRPDELWVQNA